MVYVSIPYVRESNRIDKDLVKKEIDFLGISDEAKQSAYMAIYNLQPRGVEFEEKDLLEAGKLESALLKLGIPFRRSEKSEY